MARRAAVRGQIAARPSPEAFRGLLVGLPLSALHWLGLFPLARCALAWAGVRAA